MNRYDANSFGRFTSPDKGKFALFIPVSLNRYVYGVNDPINHLDVDGNDPNNCHTTSDGLTTCEGITPPSPFTYDFGWPPSSSSTDLYSNIYNAAYFEAIAGAVMKAMNDERLADGVYRAMDKLQRPECAAMFNVLGNGMNPRDVLRDLYSSNGRWGTIEFGNLGPPDRNGLIKNATAELERAYRINAQGQRVFTGLTGRAVITLNLNGAASLNGSTDDLAATLLHELGHVFFMFPELGSSIIAPDGDNPSLSMSNSAAIKKNCF